MRFTRLLRLAWRSILEHGLRSALTTLGIIFGVAAVIFMLAIGEGQSQVEQEQIKRMGSSNVLLASVKPSAGQDASEGNSRVLTYGLTYKDLRALETTVPEVAEIVPRRDIPVDARVGIRKVRSVLMGTTARYLDVANLRLRHGRFLTPADAEGRLPVCVLGASVAERLFLNADPLGRDVLAGKHGFRVVGVLAGRGEGTGGTAGVGGESDAAMFLPLPTMRERYGNVIRDNSTGSRTREEVELHRLTLRAVRGDEATVGRIAGAVRHLMARRHETDDVRLTVPLELLRQARETSRRWTIFLGLIAGISLLVGGIGIMNIMLASVVERTREIGIRRALGARWRHIVLQFLTETVVLSVGGGLLGVGAGLLTANLLDGMGGLRTVVDPWFVGFAFGISAAIGLIFGLYPAIRAAGLDPVEALRHE